MQITNTIIEYQSQSQSKTTSHRGYLACTQDITDPVPGIVVIHNFWGVADHVRDRAERLAQQGYCALAIDMYGDGMVAENPAHGLETMSAVLADMEMGSARLKAGYAALLAQPQVDAQRTAAVGYCFGGSMVLHMARIGMPLKAVVSFHGALMSFHKPVPGEVKASVLVCHGGDDTKVSMADVSMFKQEMKDAEVDYEVIVYAGAKHGFTNKNADEDSRKYGIPEGYNAQADRESWVAMMNILERHF